jgi:hypothetical protein
MSDGIILLIGLGEVGGKALEILARRPGIARIVGADVDDTYGAQKVNNATFGAQLEGIYPNIDFVKIDLFDIDKTAETLAEMKPSVIFNCTSLQSYWVVELLPKEIHKKFQQAGFGPWLPMHLTLCRKLMQAVERSGIKTSIVNASYPDATNPTCAKVGQAPVAGIGNGENVVPQVQKVISHRLGVPMRSVFISLVMHHYAEYWVVREGHQGGASSYMRVLVDGNDVSNEFTPDELFKDIPIHALRPGRPDGHYLIASSAIQKIMAIYNDTREYSSCIPGPAGMMGGYPGRLSQKGFELELPEGITLGEAVKINWENSKLEGIEEIKDDGTVVFTERNYQLMKELLNYDCKTMTIDESEHRAAELGRLYKEFAKKYV